MRSQAKLGISVACLSIVVLLVLWWVHFMFWLPHFHEDAQGDLVSGKTKLVLVSKLLPGDKTGITVPDTLWFWDSVGIVDGNMDGRLWKFTEHGRQYVLYQPNTEMPWRWVYTYAANALHKGSS
ncbi:MAG: hypothetical protein K6T83_01835 [Alicyclobacillus sp.]|nr:hypothetical protein [Alicyclobacillus sp.]